VASTYSVTHDKKQFDFNQATPARIKYNTLCGYGLVCLFKNEDLVRYNKNGKEASVLNKRGGKENEAHHRRYSHQKYGEPTRRVSVRIPLSVMKNIKDQAVVQNVSQSVVIVRHLETL
jgi:hypothetical protein